VKGGEMIPGLTGKAEMIVQREDLVSHLEAGMIAVEVLSTPRLVQLMEASAMKSIQKFLAPDQISLGTQIKLKHLSPTPIGMRVTAHAILKEVEKNRLLFWIDAFDDREKVAEGEHERVVVSKEKFLQKVDQKKAG
jgi:fluoroacetyl-CoA thioesterase